MRAASATCFSVGVGLDALRRQQAIDDRHRAFAGGLRVGVNVLLLIDRRRDIRAFESDRAQQFPARLEIVRILRDRLLIRGDGGIDLRRFRAAAHMPLGTRIPMLIALADLGRRGEAQTRR